MFDVGFSELVLIALLALLVLGPKRLPEVARTAGQWLARLRRFIANVKQDFDRELRSADLDELRKLKEELNETRRIIEQSSNRILSDVSQGGELPPGFRAPEAGAPDIPGAPPPEAAAPAVGAPQTEAPAVGAAEGSAPARKRRAPKKTPTKVAARKSHGRAAGKSRRR